MLAYNTPMCHALITATLLTQDNMSGHTQSLTRPLAALAFCALLATPTGTAAFTDAVTAAAHVFTDVVITPLVDDIGTSVTKPVTPAATTGSTTKPATAPTKGEHR